MTLHLVAREVPASAPVDRSGFLGGLQDGWSAFTRTIGWLLTGLGAVLPFLLIIVPAALLAQWALRRSRRPAPPVAPPSPGPTAPAT